MARRANTEPSCLSPTQQQDKNTAYKRLCTCWTRNRAPLTALPPLQCPCPGKAPGRIRVPPPPGACVCSVPSSLSSGTPETKVKPPSCLAPPARRWAAHGPVPPRLRPAPNAGPGCRRDLPEASGCVLPSPPLLSLTLPFPCCAFSMGGQGPVLRGRVAGSAHGGEARAVRQSRSVRGRSSALARSENRNRVWFKMTYFERLLEICVNHV